MQSRHSPAARMDSSDRIRKVQAQAIFTHYRDTALVAQTDCNYSTCSSLLTTCVVNFPSYEERQKVNAGRLVCNSCTGQCTCGS